MQLLAPSANALSQPAISDTLGLDSLSSVSTAGLTYGASLSLNTGDVTSYLRQSVGTNQIVEPMQPLKPVPDKKESEMKKKQFR